MTSVRTIADGFGGAFAAWRRVPWSSVQFANTRVAIIAITALLALTVLVMIVRLSVLRLRHPRELVLPAILPTMRRTRLLSMRYVPFGVFLAGLPFFALGLADPRTTLSHDEATYPGRRIAIVIDGSTSMIFRFPLSELKSEGGDHAYYAAVAGAERLVRLRMSGRYRDVISLIQFGDQPYVISPFTTDYSNLLLALHLISDPDEWGHFPDYGTTIIKAFDEGLSLFDRFRFTTAAGNMMVVFTDGRDETLEAYGQTLDELCRKAATDRIPIFMIRTAYASQFGDLRQDAFWKSAVERTGGRFYAAADERSLLSAINEINELAPGAVTLRTYTAQTPEYHACVFAAICCWLVAVAFRLYVPVFRTFP